MLCDTLSIKASAIDYSKKKYDKTRWTKIREDYLDSKTNRLIFVKYKGGSNATVEMWKKVVKKIPVSSGDTVTDNSGEHLINYNPWYNYALALDYNKKCIYLKGSAIFLHCVGDRNFLKVTSMAQSTQQDCCGLNFLTAVKNGRLR